MTLTAFPNGVSSFGVPLAGDDIPTTTGNYWWVNSVTGNTGGPGTIDQPYSTLNSAIGAASANDVIIIASSHAETLASAGAVTINKTGLTIIGLGNGNARPTFTFGTATTASILISSAGTKLLNIVGIAGINALSQPIDVRAAGCTVTMEWQDGSSSVEAARAVLGSAAADRLTLNLKYIGFPAGSSCVNAVRLVGSDNAILNLDCYGKFSTSVVEFLTTACTNVEVYGYMYNSGTTNLSKDVVDTVTGSTWFSSFYDGAAGASVSGGSGSALASDDISTVAANQTVPSADSTANVLSRDAVGNKADAAVYVPSATASEVAYAKGSSDLQEKVALKAAATITNGQTLFTIAGGPIVIVGLTSICVTANDGTASTLQYSVTPTAGSAQTISAASASLASAAIGASVTLAGTALATAALLNANGPNLIANPGTIMAPAGTLTAVVAVGSTTGTWRHYIRYRPLATGVTVS